MKHTQETREHRPRAVPVLDIADGRQRNKNTILLYVLDDQTQIHRELITRMRICSTLYVLVRLFTYWFDSFGLGLTPYILIRLFASFRSWFDSGAQIPNDEVKKTKTFCDLPKISPRDSTARGSLPQPRLRSTVDLFAPRNGCTCSFELHNEVSEHVLERSAQFTDHEPRRVHRHRPLVVASSTSLTSCAVK